MQKCKLNCSQFSELRFIVSACDNNNSGIEYVLTTEESSEMQCIYLMNSMTDWTSLYHPVENRSDQLRDSRTN